MLENFKNTLLEKREELAEKLANREEIAIERSSDALDSVQRSAEREYAISSLDRDWQTLKDIDLALERFSDGEYGICQRCEEEISPKRLKAIPWAAYCINCQERIDRERRHQREDFVFSDAA
jgi:DnaK suppressor protein